MNFVFCKSTYHQNRTTEIEAIQLLASEIITQQEYGEAVLKKRTRC